VVRALLDTSVLIGAASPGDLEDAISAASLAELHFGVLVVRDPDERARRAQRLGVIEATFDPLPGRAPILHPWQASSDGLTAPIHVRPSSDSRARRCSFGRRKPGRTREPAELRRCSPCQRQPARLNARHGALSRPVEDAPPCAG